VANPSAYPRQRLLHSLLWSIVVAVAIYGASIIATDLDTVGESAASLGILGWMTVLGLSLANYGFRFVRWEVYLGRLDSRVPTLASLAYYLGGFAFTTTPGKAGEALRSFYLKRHGVSYVHSLAAFFTERLVDLVAMVLLALVATVSFPGYRWPVVVIAGLIIAILPLIHARSFHAFLERQRTRLPSEQLRSLGSRLLDMLESASTLLKSGPLYAGLSLALIAWGAEGVAFHFILLSLEIDAPLALSVGIYSVSVLAGALSFLPGGLGGTEAVMVVLLSLVGADAPTAVAATLICRIATLWFAVIIGGLVVGALELTSAPVPTNRSTACETRET